MISGKNPLNIRRRDYNYIEYPREIDLSKLGDSFCLRNKGVIQKIRVGEREYFLLSYISFDTKAQGEIATTVRLYNDGTGSDLDKINLDKIIMEKEFLGKIKFFDDSLRDTLVIEEYRGERWGYLLSDICWSCMGRYNGSNISKFSIYKVMKGNDSWAPVARMRLNYGFFPHLEIEKLLNDFKVDRTLGLNKYGKPYLKLNGFPLSGDSIKLVLKDKKGRGIEDIEFYNQIALTDVEEQNTLIRELFYEDRLFIGNIDYKIHPTKVDAFREYLEYLPEPEWYVFLRKLIR